MVFKVIVFWESYIDFYCYFVGCGGCFYIFGFYCMIGGGFVGFEGVESVYVMFEKWFFYDDYWEVKCIFVENIDNIFMYVVVLYFSMFYIYGFI